MKTKNLFLAASLLLAISAMAQIQPYPYNSAMLKKGFLSFNGTTIARHWDNNYVVFYHAGSGGGAFSCSDFSEFWDEFSSMCVSAQAQVGDPLPSEYEVKDMRIFDDNVFFCGVKHDITGDIGFVGWFDLNLFMAGNFTPHIREMSSNIASLKKLVVYKNNGLATVVAIGDIGYPNYNHAIIEIADIYNATGYSYASLSNLYEQWDDILYCGGKLVLAGTYLGRFFQIRVMDDTNLPSTSLNINDVYYFPGAANEVNNTTAATYLYDDFIAISYVHNVSDTNYVTRMRVIDINTPNPANVNSQEFIMNQKNDPIELAYSSQYETLAQLQIIQHPIYPPHITFPQFIFLKPLVYSFYTTNITYSSNISNCVSLDTYGASAIVSGSGDYAYLQDVSSQNNTACPFSTAWDVDIIPNIITIQYPNSFIFSPTIPLISLDIPMNSYQDNWYKDCCAY